MPSLTPSLRDALNDSISSGKFTDTKIILFSRRDPSGSVCKPRPLYASSHVLKTVPYFNDLLFGAFAEAESKDFSESLDDDQCADDYGYYSDSDLEEDEDSVNLKEALKRTGHVRGHLFDPLCFPPAENEPPPTYGEYTENLEGKVIKIQDVAFVTFQAFLLYLYTDSIEFAPYGSEENRKSRSVEIVHVSKDSIPRPSPKSIYRLADKYDVPALKRLALDKIKDGLDRCDIVTEIFSEFTSKYNEVRTMQVNHFASVRFNGDEKTTKNLCEKIDEKVDAYANGDLKYAAEAMSLLWEASRESRDPAPPSGGGTKNAPSFNSTPSSPPHQQPILPAAPTPTRWGCVKIALIRSIREGVFIDRKYWARHSRARKVLRPVYFSSTVAGHSLPCIDDIIRENGRKDKYSEDDDGSEDSDHEGGSDQAENLETETGVDSNEESGQGILPVLPIGNFTSWRSSFFYLCTESIRFAPLKSQGSDARTQYIRAEVERNPHAPPPYSPKAIYSLAVALDIKSLRHLALEEIRSGITSANIVSEFFSKFTSQRSEVMEMQYRLLSGRFGSRNTNASGVELIKSMAAGTGAHHAGALKFGLRKGFPRVSSTTSGMAPPLSRDPEKAAPGYYFGPSQATEDQRSDWGGARKSQARKKQR